MRGTFCDTFTLFYFRLRFFRYAVLVYLMAIIIYHYELSLKTTQLHEKSVVVTVKEVVRSFT